MSISMLPRLVAVHRRVLVTGAGHCYRYTYGLLAFPIAGGTTARAHFCILAHRRQDPGGDAPLGGEAGELLEISRTFHRAAPQAMSLFERIAFAADPLSPHHVDDVVRDCAPAPTPCWYDGEDGRDLSALVAG